MHIFIIRMPKSLSFCWLCRKADRIIQKFYVYSNSDVTMKAIDLNARRYIPTAIRITVCMDVKRIEPRCFSAWFNNIAREKIKFSAYLNGVCLGVHMLCMCVCVMRVCASYESRIYSVLVFKQLSIINKSNDANRKPDKLKRSDRDYL